MNAASLTFDGVTRRVEAYVLDREDLDLYGAHVALDFVSRVRGQVKFEGDDGESRKVTFQHAGVVPDVVTKSERGNVLPGIGIGTIS